MLARVLDWIDDQLYRGAPLHEPDASYFRAPHIYIALPTGFMPDRGNSTDILFMSAPGAGRFTRLFTEAFIRPGVAPANWGNRSNDAALKATSSEDGRG